MNQINTLTHHLATLRVFFGRTALLIFAMHAAGCGDKDKEEAQTPPVTATPQPAQPASAIALTPKPERGELTLPLRFF
ncbi:MAG: hypothetical protein Q8L79_00205 [Methylobacter sp.]|uniref:hypothetical protein n=1 Tax=Methylobacter sp. TaxID=2051955 RepID=UPI00273030BC|nr:hypothetical protein [Methylobacter sp.]MDP1663521.1 hypothetical protein [Methylobacter sp.]